MAQRHNFSTIPRPEIKSPPPQFHVSSPTVTGFRTNQAQPQHSSIIYAQPSPRPPARTSVVPVVLERYPPASTQAQSTYAQNGQQGSRKFGSAQPPPLSPSFYYRENVQPTGRNFLTLPINRQTSRTPLSGNSNFRSAPNSPQPVKVPTSYYRTYSHSPFGAAQRASTVLDKYPSVLTLNDVTVTPISSLSGRHSIPSIPSVLDRYPPAAEDAYYQKTTRNSAPATNSVPFQNSVPPSSPFGPKIALRRTPPVDNNYVPNRFRYPTVSPGTQPPIPSEYAIPQVKMPTEQSARRRGMVLEYASPATVRTPQPPPPPPVIQPTQINVPASIPAPPKRTPSNASTFVRKPSLKIKRNGSTAAPAKLTQPPVPRRKGPPPNHPSRLLTDDENQLVFQILGHGRQTLSTAVVQLLFPFDDEGGWTLEGVTILCFVRDAAKKSYFLEFIWPESGACVFSCEIYEEFTYKAYRNSRFITFEAEISQVGVNFADHAEYLAFTDTLDKKIEAKRQRREDRESRTYELNGSYPMTNGPKNVHGFTASERSYVSKEEKKSKFTFGRKTSKKNKKAKKFEKRDIGVPTDFTHVSHAGFDAKHGFQAYGDIDFSKYQAVFEEANISARELNDPATRRFIYQFVTNYEKEATPDRKMAPSPPPPPPPMPLQNHHQHPSPPIPQRNFTPQPEPEPDYHHVAEKQKAPPPPPVRAHASPRVAPPPPPPTRQQPPVATMPPAPPPPPPPPMPPLEPPRSAAYTSATSTTKEKGPVIPDADYEVRSNLMKQIQEGAKGKLKPVDETQRVGTISKGSAIDGMAEALQKALASRSRAINPDSSDSDTDSDAFDSGEWEDD